MICEEFFALPKEQVDFADVMNVQNDLKRFSAIWNCFRIRSNLFFAAPRYVTEYLVSSQKKAIPQLKLENFHRNFAGKIIAEEIKIKFQDNFFILFDRSSDDNDDVQPRHSSNNYTKRLAAISQRGFQTLGKLNCSKLPE